MATGTVDSQDAFESNRAYLSWEFKRILRQLEAFAALKADHEKADEYYTLLERLGRERTVAVEMRRQAFKDGIAIPLESLSQRFDLSMEEEEVLLWCLAPQYSSTLWDQLLHAQGNLLKPYLEVGFLAERVAPSADLVTDRLWYRGDSRLVENGLVVIDSIQGDNTPSAGILCKQVRVPQFVADMIMGRTSLDQRLVHFCELSMPAKDLSELVLGEKTFDTVNNLIKSFYYGKELKTLTDRPRRVLITGPPRSGKTSVAGVISGAMKRPLLTIHLDRLDNEGNRAQAIRHAARNAMFLGAVLHLVKPEQLIEIDKQLLGPLMATIGDFHGLVVIEPQSPQQLDTAFESLIHLSIEIERPNREQREQLWESLLPMHVHIEREVRLGELATTYDLTGGQIADAIEWACQLAEARGPDQPVTYSDLDAGAKNQLRSTIGQYTEKSKVRLTLDELVLPESSMTLVIELLDACRNHYTVMNEWGLARRLVTGRGIVTLFSGDAGTGKTLCAEIMAQELGLELQIVCIPKVVSKWVGETEKNVREIFRQARAQNCMLLFDEADSLFTSRVKVERAQDHYLNLEVNTILQEIERFDGIVILTTNLEANMDRAFERRILFRIEFLAPGEEERKKIWELHIPKHAPMEGKLDYGFLAEAFDLTGGQIKNAVVRASYRSCADGGILTQKHIEQAAQQQVRTAGKLAKRVEEIRQKRAGDVQQPSPVKTYTSYTR